MNDMSNKFGINMKSYCREHEAALSSQLPSREVLENHLIMLQRLQHERLIHLIVLVMVVWFISTPARRIARSAPSS